MDHDEARLPHQRPVSRRTLAQGLAWSVPVMWAATAAPAFAASGGCQYTAQFVSSPTNAVTSLLATSPTTSRTILIELRQTTGPCTTVTADNMATGGEGTQQDWLSCCSTRRFTNFGPSNATTLNQVVTNSGCVRGGACLDTHPSQTVTFSFLDAATRAPIDLIEQLHLTVFASSSVNHRNQYRDPTSNGAAPQDPGLGDATSGSPFRRSAGDKKSESAFQWMDTFSFTRLQRCSLTLTYSNGYYGYQFISIAGLNFVGPC